MTKMSQIVDGLFNNLKEFMQAGDVPIATKLGESPTSTWSIAKKLIEEEYKELQEAISNAETFGSYPPDSSYLVINTTRLAHLAQEAADLIYVVTYLCVAAGIPIDVVFREIHAANMRKVDAKTGKLIKREDGKILKPEGWKPANIEKTLADHAKYAEISRLHEVYITHYAQKEGDLWTSMEPFAPVSKATFFYSYRMATNPEFTGLYFMPVTDKTTLESSNIYFAYLKFSDGTVWDPLKGVHYTPNKDIPQLSYFTHYTEIEGGNWLSLDRYLPIRTDKLSNSANPLFFNTDSICCIKVVEKGAMMESLLYFHSIKTIDGLVWDIKNGWRHETPSQSE